MIWTYIIIAVVLLAAELLYFKIADKFNIIDKPNERSSHSTIVLRGGGIIFSLSMVVWAILMVVQGGWQGDRSLASAWQGRRERNQEQVYIM